MNHHRTHTFGRRKWILAAAFFACIALFGILPWRAYAAKTSSAGMSTARVLKVGYFAFDGYHEMAEDGSKSGYGYELLQMIARYENITYEYVGYDASWGEMQQMLLDGEIDFVTSASKTSEREEQFDFSERSIGTSATMLTIKAGNKDITAGDYATYDGMTVGMLSASTRNESFQKYAEEHGFTYKAIYYNTNDELKRALQDGEITAAVTSNFRTTENEWVLDTFDEKAVYAITRKGDTETMALINDAIAKMDRYEAGWRTLLTEEYYSENNGGVVNLSEEEEAYLESLKESGTVLKVAVNPDRYPYSFLDDDGKLTGIMVDEFAEIAGHLDLDYEIVQVQTRPEYVELIKSGEAEICLDMHEDYSTAESYGYKITDIYLDAQFSWILRKDFSGEPKVVGVIGASSAKSTTISEDAYSDIEYKYYDSFEDCLKALRSGEVDGYYTYTYSAEKVVYDDVHNDLKTRLFAIGVSHFCIGVQKDMDVCLLDALNKGIDTLTVDEKEIITEKYVVLNGHEFSIVRLAYEYPSVIVLMVVSVIFVIVLLLLTVRAHHLQAQTHAALKKAESADRAKTAFLSNMSHDIRTPINGIMGMLEIAANNINDTEKVSDCLAKMKRAAGHLLSLINDVLDMSKIEADSMELDEEPFDVRILMDACCSIIEGQKEQRKLSFVREIGEFEHPYLFGSELYIRRILINILGNAVKYTPDGGTITLRAGETGFSDGMVSLRIAVTDTGIGMDEEFLQRIFEPFTQERNGSRSHYNGTGLGMAISKRLAEQMGGTLEAESTPGKGSTFTFCVTLPEADRPEPEALQNEECSFPEGMRILLAEDNELNREIAVELLEEKGCIVTTARDGAEAVEKFRTQKDPGFDVILMDVMMPEMDGLEATRRIREMEGGTPDTGVPIIAMTANVFANDVKACLDAGMNSHVGKPIDMSKLSEEIAKVTKK